MIAEARDPSDRPRLAVFTSARSGPSRRIDGYLAQVLQRRHNHDTFEVVRVDLDSRPDLGEKFRITKIPTLLVIDGGRIRARLAGPSGSAAIRDFLDPWLR